MCDALWSPKRSLHNVSCRQLLPGSLSRGPDPGNWLLAARSQCHLHLTETQTLVTPHIQDQLKGSFRLATLNSAKLPPAVHCVSQDFISTLRQQSIIPHCPGLANSISAFDLSHIDGVSPVCTTLENPSTQPCYTRAHHY